MRVMHVNIRGPNSGLGACYENSETPIHVLTHFSGPYFVARRPD